jgi:hypothetical protein
MLTPANCKQHRSLDGHYYYPIGMASQVIKLRAELLYTEVIHIYHHSCGQVHTKQLLRQALPSTCCAFIVFNIQPG